MEIKHSSLILTVLFDTVAFAFASSCQTTNYVAAVYSKKLSTHSLSGSVHCTWYIKPPSTFKMATDELNGHYLYIYWNMFDIKDKMPECHESYVEIKIGKSKHTLGRFCSQNSEMRYPFSIYSPDGYATISFKMDLRRSGGISLSYYLKRNLYSSTLCKYTSVSHWADVANIYSPTWPKLTNAASCVHKIDSSLSKRTKIVFMDYDLPGSFLCIRNNYGVEVRGSSSGAGFSSSAIVMRKRCGQRDPFSIVTSSRYIYIKYYGGFGPYANRGYMAGIIKYGKRETFSSSGNFSQLLGGLIGLGVLIIIALVTFVCIRQRLARRRASRMQGATVHAPYSSGTVTVQTQLNPAAPPSSATVSRPPGPPVELPPPSYNQAVGGYQPVHPGPGFEYPPAAYPGPVVKPPPPGSSYPPPGPLPYPETQGAPYPPETTAPYPTSYAAQYPPANAAPYPTTTQDQIPGSNPPPAFAPGYGASAPPS